MSRSDPIAASALYSDSRRSHLAVAALLALAVVCISVFAVDQSTLSDPDHVAYELVGIRGQYSPDRWVDPWMWGQKAPFRYRLLGRLPVWASYKAMVVLASPDRRMAIYASFVLWSWIFLALALHSLQGLLRTLLIRLSFPTGSRRAAVAGGAILFCLMPPILFGFKYPVHLQPNDLLGYALLGYALDLVLRGRHPLSGIVNIVAVFCRETNMIVPFVALFDGREPIRRRLVLSLAPLLVLIAYRTAWPGSYDPFIGARLNLRYPVESLAFLMLTFGPLWTLGMVGYFWLRNQQYESSSPVPMMLRSFPYAMALILASVVFLARMREIRILYVAFIFMIPFSVVSISRLRTEFLYLARDWKYLAYLLLVLFLSAYLYFLLGQNGQPHAPELGRIFNSIYLNEFGNWRAVLAIYLFLFLASLPWLSVLRRISSPRPQTIA